VVSSTLGPLLVAEGYMTEEDASIQLGVSADSLATWRKKQVGPQYTTLARTILYNRTSLVAWLTAGGSRECDQ
jgi:hypothetical protein